MAPPGVARRGRGGSRRWPGASARAGDTPLSFWRGRKTTGGEAAVGWAVLGRLVAPGKWLEELGQVGFSLSFF